MLCGAKESYHTFRINACPQSITWSSLNRQLSRQVHGDPYLVAFKAESNHYDGVCDLT